QEGQKNGQSAQQGNTASRLLKIVAACQPGSRVIDLVKDELRQPLKVDVRTLLIRKDVEGLAFGQVPRLCHPAAKGQVAPDVCVPQRQQGINEDDKPEEDRSDNMTGAEVIAGQR